MPSIKRKKKIAEKPSYNLTEMTNTQLEFFKIKEQKKLLEKREAELKKRLDEFMQASIKPDKKGHYLFSTVDEKGNPIHLQKQARKKVQLNEERAKAFLLENGHDDVIVEKEFVAADVTQDQITEIIAKHATHFLDVKEAVDEVALEQLITEGTISLEEFESICDINVTYAMTFVDDKKLQQEDEEHAVKGKRKTV